MEVVVVGKKVVESLVELLVAQKEEKQEMGKVVRKVGELMVWVVVNVVVATMVMVVVEMEMMLLGMLVGNLRLKL